MTHPLTPVPFPASLPRARSNLSSNSITSLLPATWVHSVEQLDLSHNPLGGTLPARLPVPEAAHLEAAAPLTAQHAKLRWL